MEHEHLTVLPAGDLLALIEHSRPDGDTLDFSIERILAISIDTDDHEAFEAEYFIDNYGWLSTTTTSVVRTIAGPADIARIARKYLARASAGNHLGDTEGIEPWMDLESVADLYPEV